MKEQYFGNINDYHKYALLRILADRGKIKVGVCWMLTLPDGCSDGDKTEYLKGRRRRESRSLDPELFDLLKVMIDKPGDRRLCQIEASGVIPGAEYINGVLHDSVSERSSYFQRALAGLSETDVIFFDPDTGLEVPSTPKGRKHSSKYLYKDEIKMAWDQKHSLLIYQHFARESKEQFTKKKASALSQVCPGASVWELQTPHVVFFLVVSPDHFEKLDKRWKQVRQRFTTGFSFHAGSEQD